MFNYKHITIIGCLIFCWGVLSPSPVIGKEYKQIPLAIQISSTVSDGKYGLEEIIYTVKEAGFKAVILTERDLMRWEYGIWPLRNVLKRKVENNSLFRFGIKRYLDKIEELKERNPDLMILNGIESAPYYYWKGAPLSEDFSIINWHKHFLTFGLKKYADYANLPVVGNLGALALPRKIKNIFYLWPLFLIGLGVWFLLHRKFDYRDAKGMQLAPYSSVHRITGIVLIIIGVLFVLENPRFVDYKFDQYSGDLKEIPYQNYINYVNSRGGMVFWAHPEAGNTQQENGITIETKPQPEDMLATSAYKGFAIFYEGYNKVGIPGGLWDKILLQYCRKERQLPAWAIGALAFDTEPNLKKNLEDLRNMVLVGEENQEEVLRALSKGKNYVIRGGQSNNFILEKFMVKSNQEQAEWSGELKISQPPSVAIKGNFLDGQARNVLIKLIRDGEVIQVFDTLTPFAIDYADNTTFPPGESYYRLEITGKGLHVITNPIFVVR